MSKRDALMEIMGLKPVNWLGDPKYWSAEKHERVLAWLEAEGIDPDKIARQGFELRQNVWGTHWYVTGFEWPFHEVNGDSLVRRRFRKKVKTLP